jgi:hypothetical protein
LANTRRRPGGSQPRGVPESIKMWGASADGLPLLMHAACTSIAEFSDGLCLIQFGNLEMARCLPLRSKTSTLGGYSGRKSVEVLMGVRCYSGRPDYSPGESLIPPMSVSAMPFDGRSVNLIGLALIAARLRWLITQSNPRSAVTFRLDP